MECRFHIVLAVILASLAPAVASADIFTWTDDAGVSHFTNLKAELPTQQAVQVVVDEQVWGPRDAPLPEVKEDPVVQSQPPPDTERNADDEVRRAYLAGLDSGLASTVSTGGSVYISGPLAVTISSPESYPASYPLYQPGYDWLTPGYIPFITTSTIARPRGLQRGRVRTGFHRRIPAFPPSINAAGPPPIGAAGPPPIGAAGRSPVGAAGGVRSSGSRTWR
jgi:hypothetical protein